MSLKSKLKNWVECELISDRQAEDILAFQKENLAIKLHEGLRYAAYLAFVLGIALIVAANWDALGLYFKLGAHFLVNMSLAGVIWYWRHTDKGNIRVLREGAVYLFCGLTLTLLALIGQSFHLQGSLGGMLALWMGLITGVVVTVGQNRRIAILWCLGFMVTLVTNFEFLATIKPEYISFYILLSCAVFLPFLFYLLSHMSWMRNLNDAFCETIAQISVVVSLILGGLSSLLFYGATEAVIQNIGLSSAQYFMGLGLILAVFMIMAILTYRGLHRDGGWLIVITSCFFTIAPFFLILESDIIAALYFILYAMVIAVIAMKTGHETVLSFCLFAVSARLFIIFIELFGSMLSTGWGLIIAGCVLLGILKTTQMIRHKILKRGTDA